ncbi:histidinol dehydrogenase [Cyanobacterium sp. IPPAS B-1200]|uniref:histidinol dehydrogenase n=1 Tax=Cyanobacterium sp. IPPAS B-1200 TaxID=1562720 RepID=UPI0008526DB3|nr:histidinol dehydrogenase [Cyanobacterium sp. IPPAS B-1200]OEJ78867.1 histidinol dehydrogenase [Cyanobacterium sp. IPPAS B-1200]
MLRIITDKGEAKQELKRIENRTHNDETHIQESIVKEIIATVRKHGNQALFDYTQKFDRQTINESNLKVSGAEIDAAYQQISRDLLSAIKLAAKQIEAFHQQKVPKSWVNFPSDGVVLGRRYTPVDRAGLYVPGGRASYPSTVLMNAIPAKVAQVPRIVMVTPPSEGAKINPAVLVAASEAGVTEIYRVGGAQAVAALAYGTETIPNVDVITGPGNIFVTLAKKEVFGTVGIDSLAGPSEVLVIADKQANPIHVAADLLAQAEHDPLAAAILITDDVALAQAVQGQVVKQLENHPRKLLTEKAIAHYGVIIVTENLEEAAELSNLFAPEHLELEVEEPWDLTTHIRHAGAIFLGNSTPEAVGDYLAGPNHTLPTSGAARYASALGVETFMKYSSLIEYSPQALQKVSDAVMALTEAEGLPSHGDSVRLRVNPDEK